MYATMQAVHNFFEQTAEFGNYTISSNAITTVRGEYLAGQYVRIMGSLLNDGVYLISSVQSGSITLTGTFTNESFYGYIVGLAVPKEFVTLAAKVEEFDNAGVKSESIPNYSVTYDATDGVSAYNSSLSIYRKPVPISPYYFLNWVRIYG